MTVTTAPAIAVPLRLRPPNPPEPFVGRAAERARLHKTLQRGPVGLVWGFSGVGKSSLVRAVLADDAAAARTSARWLVVEARAGRCPVVLLLHALAGIPGVRLEVDTATLPDPGARAPADDGLADAAVTALEDHGLGVFIDDVVRVDDAPRLVALLALARRFARQARVVVVCREDPRDPALLSQSIALGPLPDDDVVALLVDAQPTLAAPEARALARRARGSPWRALQLTLGGDDGLDDDHGPERSLLSLSPAAQGLLRTLALVPAAIPRTTLARATRLPAADVLDSLARRGWLEVHADAVRLHSAARPVVSAVVHADADERRMRGHKLLTALVDADDADVDVDLALAALPLVHDAGDEGALLRLLERHGDALRHAGHAPLLWSTVRRLAGPTSPAAIAAWAAAIAADVGDDAIAALGGTTGARRPARLDWQRAAADARALHDRGRTHDALALLRAQAPTTATVEDTAALLLRGDLAVVVADLDDAEDCFARAAAAPRARARLHARVGLLEVRLARGDLGGLVDALGSTLLELRQRADDDDLLARGNAVAAALRSLDARPDEGAGRGGDGPRPSPRRSPSSSTNALLADAVAALTRGDARAALDGALQARGKLAQRGHALAALEAGVLAVDAAIAASEREALPALAAALRDESHAARSPRFALEARFAAACAGKDLRGGLDPALLVELTQATSTSPVVARRARALLGEDVALDDVDRAVLAQLGAGGGKQATTTTTTTTTRPAAVARVVRDAAGPEWTVEASAMRILLADGRAVDLSSKKVLFDLLCALCRRGGAATKEQLLQDAWGVRDYHPLHHDNRLKVAVRKLRRLLEDLLGADPIEARDDGYRVRGRVRFIA